MAVLSAAGFLVIGTGCSPVAASILPNVVTAHGAKARHCSIGGIRTTSRPQVVGVRCFDFSGAAADAKFTLGYAR
jgi:hypothetical protein